MSVSNQKLSGNKGTNTGYQVAITEIEKNLLQRITATGGSELISDTSAHTGKNYYAFIAQEDTVIFNLSGGVAPSTSLNYLDSLGLSGKTIHQGALFTVPLGEIITNITLMSGSIIGYKQIK